MSDDRAIIEAIQKISGTQLNDKVRLYAASVVSVDEPTRTCVVTTISSQGSMTIENVQLMASLDDGILLLPAVDSTVIVSYSTYNQPFISLFSELQKVLLIVGSSILSIKDGIIQFNDGSNGGLVEVIKLTTKLNNLENLVNDLVSKYNTHTHILTLTSGTGTAAPTAAPESTVITPTQRSDIENTLIKQ
jgi:hypothetical protein